jgi:hypothetical protein
VAVSVLHCLILNVPTHFLLSLSVSSQCARSEVKPLTEDRGYDSVLLGQSNRTPHGAVIDEYGWSNGGMIYLQGKPKYSEKTCPVPHIS